MVVSACAAGSGVADGCVCSSSGISAGSAGTSGTSGASWPIGRSSGSGAGWSTSCGGGSCASWTGGTSISGTTSAGSCGGTMSEISSVGAGSEVAMAGVSASAAGCGAPTWLPVKKPNGSREISGTEGPCGVSSAGTAACSWTGAAACSRLAGSSCSGMAVGAGPCSTTPNSMAFWPWSAVRDVTLGNFLGAARRGRRARSRIISRRTTTIQKVQTATSSGVADNPIRASTGTRSWANGRNRRTAVSSMDCVTLWTTATALPDVKNSRTVVHASPTEEPTVCAASSIQIFTACHDPPVEDMATRWPGLGVVCTTCALAAVARRVPARNACANEQQQTRSADRMFLARFFMPCAPSL